MGPMDSRDSWRAGMAQKGFGTLSSRDWKQTLKGGLVTEQSIQEALGCGEEPCPVSLPSFLGLRFRFQVGRVHRAD